MNKRLERLEYNQRMREMELNLLQTSLDLTALAREIAAINERDKVEWAELINKQDEILRLNREALTK